MANDDKPTTERIREWMESGGRPLEMQVAAQFMKSASSVEQSPFYTDAETEKPREIDVVAVYGFGDASDLYLGSVAVECKSKPEPFIVLLPSKSDLMAHRCLSQRARPTMPNDADLAAVDLYATSLFDPAVPTGHSLLTMTTRTEQERDKAWAAAMSAAKAAHWHATRRDTIDHKLWHIAFPVVVTDGVLATAELVDGVIEVKEAEHARFALKWPLGTQDVVVVDIVRARALADFAAGCGTAIGVLAKHAASQWPGG